MSTMTFIAVVLISAMAATALAACGDGNSRTEVSVTLTSFRVTSDKASVRAGKTTFTASNVHATDVHELAVLKISEDGSLENFGEVEDIGPGKSGHITIDLKPGNYLLACLISVGEAGSTEDHFARGMQIEFAVQ